MTFKIGARLASILLIGGGVGFAAWALELPRNEAAGFGFIFGVILAGVGCAMLGSTLEDCD